MEVLGYFSAACGIMEALISGKSTWMILVVVVQNLRVAKRMLLE